MSSPSAPQRPDLDMSDRRSVRPTYTFPTAIIMNDQTSSTVTAQGNCSDFRHRSAVLSTFPWSTDLITKEFKGLLENKSYLPFVNSIADFEDALSETSEDTQTIRLQHAMVTVSPESTSMPNPRSLLRPYPQRVCEILCVYKLLDVLYDVQENRDTSFGNPMYPKYRLHAFLPRRGWPLENWRSLLLQAKLSMNSLSFGDIPSTNYTQTVPLKLFRELVFLSQNQKALKILMNIQLAALHLACVFQGTARQDPLAVPNITPEPQKWDSNAMLTDEETEFLNTYLKMHEIQKIRHPLYGALLFSPLYLLSDRQLINNAWDQEVMLKLAKSLGNRKPRILVTVERMLWESLLEIATGGSGIYHAMKIFFGKVPWDQISEVSAADAGYFADDQSLPAPSVHFSSFDGESDIKASWPLARARSPSPIIHPPTVPEADTDTSVQPSSLIAKRITAPVKPASTTDKPSDQPRKSERLMAQVHTGKPKTSSGVKDVTKTRKPKANRKVGPAQRHQVKPVKPLTIIPFQEVEKGIFIQKVRVKMVKNKKITFNHKTVRTRVKGQIIQLFEPSGALRQWTPEFHFQSDLSVFERFYSLMTDQYIEGRPKYLSLPESSSIKVISFEDYDTMSVEQVQLVLRKRHIVVTNIPTDRIVDAKEVKFDEDGLQLLTNLEARIEFHDQSIEVGDDHSIQLCTGTLQHLLASAEQGGAILNALSFPLPLSQIKKTGFGSEVEAWRLTEGLPYCDNDVLYPTSDMRWGLAATAGARHWIHIDCDGMGTVVDILCGRKLWMLFGPGEGTSFGEIDQFLDDFDVTQPSASWSVEGVYLEPGTRLIMKPNTPHAVFTTDHCIAVGGHFFSLANIQPTFFGIVHCFVLDTLVTNTEHPKTRILLFRILQYVYKYVAQGADKKHVAHHLPPFDQIQTFVDLMTLCNFCILSNVLDSRTYHFPDLVYGHTATSTHLSQRQHHDYNALSPDDRHYFSYIRGLAINLIHWINCHYIFKSKKGRYFDFLSLSRFYLHQHVRAVLYYKISAEKVNIRGVPNCTSKDLRCQIELLFAEGMAEFRGLSLSYLKDSDTLVCETELSPMKRANPLPFEEWDPHIRGTTKGDKMFHAGSVKGFPLSKEESNSQSNEEGNNSSDNSQVKDAEGNRDDEEDGNNGSMDKRDVDDKDKESEEDDNEEDDRMEVRGRDNASHDLVGIGFAGDDDVQMKGVGSNEGESEDEMMSDE